MKKGALSFKSVRRWALIAVLLLIVAAFTFNFWFYEEHTLCPEATDLATTAQSQPIDGVCPPCAEQGKCPDTAEILLRTQPHAKTTEKRPPRVLILSSGVGYDYILKNYPRLHQNRFCYAAMHGYTAIIDGSNYLSNQQRGGMPLKPDWIKPASILKWLPYYDWVFYTDPDLLVFNFTQSLQPWMDMDGYDFILPQENIGYRVFSLFTILIRNTPFARKFITEWWADRHEGCDMHGDQVPFHMLMLDYMAKLNGEENYQRPCRAHCNMTNYYCFSDEAARLGWSGNPSQNKPPFFFTPYDPYNFSLPIFGLQGKWGLGALTKIVNQSEVFMVHHHAHDVWTGIYDDTFKAVEGQPVHCSQPLVNPLPEDGGMLNLE